MSNTTSQQEWQDARRSGRQATDSAEPPLTEAWYGATFAQAVTRFGKKALHFRGYASPSEFWWVQLGLLVVNGLLMALLRGVRGGDATVFSSEPAVVASVIVWLVQIALLVAQMSLVWRRLHDTGRSGALFFVAFIPVVGLVVAAALLAMPTDAGGRREEWTDTDPRPTLSLGR